LAREALEVEGELAKSIPGSETSDKMRNDEKTRNVLTGKIKNNKETAELRRKKREQ